MNINIIDALFINSTDFHPSSTRQENGIWGVCDGCNAHRLTILCLHCHIRKAGKQGKQSKLAGTDGARVFADRKYRSLLGNFPSRIAGNAENSPIRQGGAQAQETGGAGEETLPQETCRQREAVCR